jgi:protein arginine kinase
LQSSDPGIKQKNISDHVINSNITIIRNIEDYPFVSLMTPDKRKKLESDIIDFLKKQKYGIIMFDLSKLDDDQKKIFFENNMLSLETVQKNESKFIIIGEKSILITLNSNDHLNISLTRNDFMLEEEYDQLDSLETKLGDKFPFAASSKYGFLTSYIKDCGLGMKLSVLVHLPGITLQSKTEEVLPSLIERGYEFEKYRMPEEFKFSHGYYYISSIMGFGMSEKQLISRFHKGIESLIDMDRKSLFEYYEKNKNQLDDTILRSLGALKYAAMMSYEEAFEHLTNLRTGLELGKELPVTSGDLNRLFFDIKEGNVNKFAQDNDLQKSAARSVIIKTIIK